MNPSSDADPTPSGEPRRVEENPSQGSPSNWREALMALIASRVALIQLESKEAARENGRRVVFVIAAICAFVFAWALLMAGLVAILSEAIGKPWSWVAVGFAILHLLAGAVLARLAKASGAPAFPVTRAEFQKDREWIENFTQTPKSND